MEPYPTLLRESFGDTQTCCACRAWLFFPGWNLKGKQKEANRRGLNYGFISNKGNPPLVFGGFLSVSLWEQTPQKGSSLQRTHIGLAAPRISDRIQSPARAKQPGILSALLTNEELGGWEVNRLWVSVLFWGTQKLDPRCQSGGCQYRRRNSPHVHPSRPVAAYSLGAAYLKKETP